MNPAKVTRIPTPHGACRYTKPAHEILNLRRKSWPVDGYTKIAGHVLFFSHERYAIAVGDVFQHELMVVGRVFTDLIDAALAADKLAEQWARTQKEKALLRAETSAALAA